MSGMLQKILKQPLRSSRREVLPSTSRAERFTGGNENNTEFPFDLCRICLAMNIKMYDMMEQNLNVKYEKVTGLEISSYDKLPQKLCWECVARLLSANNLRRKALISRKILLNKIKGDRCVTVSDIKQIHGDQLTQKSSLVSHIPKPNSSYLHIIEYEQELFDNTDTNTDYYKNIKDSDFVDLDSDLEVSDSCNKLENNIKEKDINEEMLVNCATVTSNVEEDCIRNKNISLADKEMEVRDSEIAEEIPLNKVVIISNELIYPINGEGVELKDEEVFTDSEEVDSDFQLLYDTLEISTNTMNTSATNARSIDRDAIHINAINENPVNTSIINAIPINISKLVANPINTSTINAIPINTSTLAGNTINTSTINSSPINTSTLAGNTINTSTINSSPINTTTINFNPTNSSTIYASPINTSTTNASIINTSEPDGEFEVTIKVEDVDVEVSVNTDRQTDNTEIYSIKNLIVKDKKENPKSNGETNQEDTRNSLQNQKEINETNKTKINNTDNVNTNINKAQVLKNVASSEDDNLIAYVGNGRKRKSDTAMLLCDKLRKEVKIILHDIGKQYVNKT